jgi:hypothetical protein
MTNTTIGRPERDEAVEYYFTYIDLVPDGDIRLILDEQGQETLAFLEGLPESLATHRYAPDKWSVSEVVSHVNDCERLFAMRAFWFARAMDSPLPSFDPDFAATTANAADRAWSTHLHELGVIRASTADLFRYLPAEAWIRRGFASGNPFTVRALAYIAAGHVIHHMNVLRQRYLTGA